ncbi:CLUMA_CG001492, isoform A [Clunio marinus]|uniref:CLUMA_CG001492, isoform A n=1 Tax=Clunio marinus TaxID=568069 RepID=A0A1J1HML3_9DIPT|nr:CLUMA_CG001492, isoform A [Clunio marinus]
MEFLNQPTLNAAMCATMDDILIVTTKQSELGILWVNYLKACFDKITKQRGRMSFNFLHIKIDDDKLDSDLIQRCQTTKLQIVIICPLLINLDHVYVKKKLSHIIKADRTIGLLLDVKEVQLMDIHREMLPSYNKWRKCVVRDQDQSFVSGLLGIAQDILGRALRQRPMANEVSSFNYAKHGPSSTAVAGKNHDNFTVIPRKMRIGQTKATVMMTEPILKDDYIKIRIEKIGHTIEVNNIKRRNPYTIHFNVPDSCMEISMMIGVRVFKNNVDLGVRPIKCESRLRELEQILKNVDAPMEFMCQALGISTADHEKLDLHMVQLFQKNIPPDFHLLATQFESSNGMRLHKEASPEEYPTLMHFAARWGLERLGLLLLECPGAEMACEIKNVSGKTPADIAELHDHLKLASSFKNFSKMNEFTTMYHYFKEFSKTSPEKAVIDLKGDQLPPTEEFTNDSYPPHYLEMKSSNGSDNNNNEISDIGSAVTNINYLNIDNDLSDVETFDTVDCAGPMIEMQIMKKRDSKDLLNNLNDMKIKEEDEKEITNELKITEDNYYDSNSQNKVAQAADDFSNECSDVLENTSQTETSSLSPSTVSVPSSSSDNQLSLQSSDYLIQPSNRPVTNAFGDYMTHPSNKPLESVVDSITHDYMNQTATCNNLQTKREASHLRLYFKKKSDSISEDAHGYTKIHELASPTKSIKSTSTLKSLKRTGSDASKKSVDDELVEIINDFKNKVFTIQEVEELVSSWKNRNDVKKSFKEKQEQLQNMREEYERIQQMIKDNLKRPSPFERMKRIFTRKHDKDCSEILPVNLTGDPKFSNGSSSNRPNSTLSLASSNSSGRMSTNSSLGDSGTHSDHEDRRNHQHSLRVGQPGSLVMDNYLIPPAPRPISTPSSTPTIEDKASLQSFPTTSQNGTPIDIEHYILFPSNVPIFPSPPPMSTFKGKH